ncbi:DTNBP1 family protein [Megaselia abdita]
MLNNFKKKLTNVIQEGKTLSENFSTLKLSIPSTPKESYEFGFPTNINVSAGCALLDHYERSWEDLHGGTVENARLADKVDSKITSLRTKAKTMETNISDMNSCLLRVPAIRENLKNCLEKITEIRSLCETVELGIVGLQDVVEQCDVQEKQLEEKYQLSLYKQRKMTDLEVYRQSLATKHQQTAKDYEVKLKQIQKERQEVFESAFKNDLEEFKKSGNVPKINSAPVDKSTLLEEVILDDIENNNDLESFLSEG